MKRLRLWICRVTNRVHIALTQTGRHSILKCTSNMLMENMRLCKCDNCMLSFTLLYEVLRSVLEPMLTPLPKRKVGFLPKSVF